MNNDNDSSISSGSCSCNDYNFGPYEYDISLLKITNARFSIISENKKILNKKSKTKTIEKKNSKIKKHKRNISRNNVNQEPSVDLKNNEINKINKENTCNNIHLSQKSSYKNKNRYFILDEDIHDQKYLKTLKKDRSKSERGIKLKNINESKKCKESTEKEIKTVVFKKGEKIVPLLKEVRILDPLKKIIENEGQKILVNENTTLTTITTNEIITDKIDESPDSVLIKQYISRIYKSEISKINCC